MKTAAGAMVGAVVLAFGGEACAHHAAAMFDVAREVTVTGTVKEFQYTNPHSWLQVDVADASGKTTTWAFEGEGPSTLLRNGVKRSSLRAGEKISVKTHPLKAGGPAGVWLSATKADGTVLNPRGTPPATGAAPRPAA